MTMRNRKRIIRKKSQLKPRKVEDGENMSDRETEKDKRKITDAEKGEREG